MLPQRLKVGNCQKWKQTFRGSTMNEQKRPADAERAARAAILQISRSRRFDSVPIAAFRSFVTVVETGGFAPASRELRLAVSTVSKHVEMLETRLKTNLLLRTTRRVSLTDAGGSLYKQCRTILDQLDDVVENSLRPGVLRGRLRVVSPPSFTRRILSPALPEFLERHPELRVELRVTTANLEFLRDGVDVAIRMMLDHVHSDQVERIGSAPSILCASPDYLARIGVPQRPEDLAAHRCLGGISSPYSENWQFKVAGEVVELPVKCSFLTDTGDVLRDACIGGLGIAGFYEFHVEDDLKAGRLVPILKEFQADVSSVFIVRPSSRYASPSVLAFTSFVRELWNSRSGQSMGKRKS